MNWRPSLLLLVLSACGGEPASPPLFTSLPPESTGVAFANQLPEDSAFNILNYLYYYNGGGVAAGDVDGDSLPDLYFTSNLGSNRLYRNRGNFQFEDVTARAGVADSVGWKSGVTMADVNGDGRLDIYVSGVDYLSMHGRNVLYVNNGDGTFSDRTREYGLEHVGYSTQALFFDYDRDGDLDMYMLNHSTHTERAVAPSTSRLVRSPRAGDRLYRNDRNRFVDVSAAAGIYGGVEGFGLGVVASDFDRDGCFDLYIANDFPENDFLYRNNCNGTFTESIARATGHTSRFSMGVDAADFNNDGRPDLAVLDMLPDREDILKTSANAESYTLFNLKIRSGYHAQYARNTLQLNRGRGRFSEIGYLAGVAATDWSWAALFADLDNDGFKDLLVTNGIYRRPNDLDYINYVGNEARRVSDREGLEKMPRVPLAKYAFRNNGDLTFTDRAAEWGLAQPGFSNGAAYVDLNNDGALDLVVNNVNAPASIYRNRGSGGHYLQVALRGSGANTGGIGTKVTIWHAGRQQLVEAMPTRGFQSSVDPRLHFGLGAATQVDSLIVVWPDRRSQVLTNVAGDRTITLSQSDARSQPSNRPTVQPLFVDVTDRIPLDYRHRENPFFDYDREPLMPHLLSMEGPALAVGDVNGDGLDDFYAGGAKWQPGKLFLQGSDGGFRGSAQPAFRADSLHEDVDAAFFDADGDSDLDLYVVSGGNEFWDDAEPLRDRLYVNDGRGNFTRARDATPEFFHNGSCVVPGDFDRDGDTDLFIGSRVVTRQYAVIPRSYLLANDGTGRFRDVTATAPGLADAGMVSSAAWLDYDRDGFLDLIVVGEWMPVRVFHQANGRFTDRTREAGLAGTNGWWNHVAAADLNGDSLPDLVLGNLGLNSYIRASLDEPARLYVRDFFQNGTIEQVLTFYKHGVSYPMAGRDELARLFPALRSRYPSYAAFGDARAEDIFGQELRQARVLEASTFASAVALNRRGGTFALEPLATAAQFAPVYASLARDFDGDSRIDLLVAGNFSGVTPLRGRYDASYGLLLRGDSAGAFTAVEMEESGLEIDGEVRHLALLRRANGEILILVARNNDRLQLISVK